MTHTHESHDVSLAYCDVWDVLLCLPHAGLKRALPHYISFDVKVVTPHDWTGEF